MLIQSLPVWIVLIGILVILIGKWYLITKFLEMPGSKAYLATKSWIASATIVAGGNAIITFLVISFVAGMGWGVVCGLLDGVIHWTLTYFHKRGRLPILTAGNVLQAEGWIGSIKSWLTGIPIATYLGISAFSSTFGLSHPSSITSLLSMLGSFLHLTK